MCGGTHHWPAPRSAILGTSSADQCPDAATRLNAAIVTVMKQTTEPFAAQVAMKAAGEELENFINIFRKELGRDEYTESDAQKQVLTFMENLKFRFNVCGPCVRSSADAPILVSLYNHLWRRRWRLVA
jgi:hypothetical protein